MQFLGYQLLELEGLISSLNINPEIMKLRGQSPLTKTIESDDEFLFFCKKELFEEMEEFIEASKTKNPNEAKEELADILEVLDALCQLKNYDLAAVQKLKDKKRSEKGGFSKKIILI
jgi:predicted house-cleaning noncanonical NTP pyrophosphatase (MazG superfamily)